MYANLLRDSPELAAKMDNSERSLLNLWKDVTVDDIWVYFCILLLTGIINKPSFHLYWSTDNIIVTPIFSRLMRRDRFEMIRSMIHFSDPLHEEPADSLRKLCSFLDELQFNFSTNYVPQQHVAVDEYLSLWKGCLHFKQYIPSKRERYGVKIYMLCESASGYLSTFIIYTF